MLGSVPAYCVVYHVEILQCFAVSIVELSSHTCCGSLCSQSVFMGRIYDPHVLKSIILTS